MGMRESTYFLLAALLDGRRHGYAIIGQVAELSDGRVKLAAGTLYATLDRLTADGLVAADGEEIVNGRARRYYVLTERGAAALRAEAARMATAARIINDRSVLRRAGRINPQAGPA
jgi:DNA-binding PadR family transcriptional regulator